mmetsp:Transcript_34394/g.82237  ORF Transcript_34394/g.82237 Transcript_34394/m.82237 type:complete len:257 (+) Transcript_34394:373-1143(+)
MLAPGAWRRPIPRRRRGGPRDDTVAAEGGRQLRRRVGDGGRRIGPRGGRGARPAVHVHRDRYVVPPHSGGLQRRSCDERNRCRGRRSDNPDNQHRGGDRVHHIMHGVRRQPGAHAAWEGGTRRVDPLRRRVAEAHGRAGRGGAQARRVEVRPCLLVRLEAVPTSERSEGPGRRGQERLRVRRLRRCGDAGPPQQTRGHVLLVLDRGHAAPPRRVQIAQRPGLARVCPIVPESVRRLRKNRRGDAGLAPLLLLAGLA